MWLATIFIIRWLYAARGLRAQGSQLTLHGGPQWVYARFLDIDIFTSNTSPAAVREVLLGRRLEGLDLGAGDVGILLVSRAIDVISQVLWIAADRMTTAWG